MRSFLADTPEPLRLEANVDDVLSQSGVISLVSADVRECYGSPQAAPSLTGSLFSTSLGRMKSAGFNSTTIFFGAHSLGTVFLQTFCAGRTTFPLCTGRSELAFGAHGRPAHRLRLSSRRFRPCSAVRPLGPAAITTSARGLGRVVALAHHTDWLPAACILRVERATCAAQDKSSRAGSLRAQTTTPRSNTPVRSRPF